MNYRIIIDQHEIDLDSEEFPLTDTGQPGSILDIALGNGVRLNHTCGGVCSCTTCHVYVKSGIGSCSKPSRAEMDRLAEVFACTEESRLACQCIPDGSKKVVVEIP